MKNYLLGLDFGTGGCKAALTDDKAQVLGYAFREYPIINEKPGWSEHDPHLYWQFTCEMFKEVINKSGIRPDEICGLGISCALPCLVMVNKEHQPLHRAYNLMDRRATSEVQWIKEYIGEERLYKITGYRLDDHPNIVNLMWERNNRPNIYKNIYKGLTIGGYITFILTGKAIINRSDATFFGAYDLRKNEFNKQIIEELGLDYRIFPEVHTCEEVVGQITLEAAEECGLAAGISVAGQSDAMAGWIGGGAIEIGDCQCNLGSVGCIGILHNDYDFVESKTGYMIGITSSYTIKGMLVTIPATMTGGLALRYLRDTFSQVEVQTEQLTGLSAYDLMNMEAIKVPPGSEGLIILPTLMGEKAPLWDVQSRGVIFGLSLNHGKGHLVRAMMEGVAFALYDSFSMITNCGLKINYPLVMNEGGAVSKLWRQIITDVFNIPTVLLKNRTGAPYGDCILAGVSTGLFKDFSVAREKVEYIELLEPIPQNHEIYQNYFSVYKKIYESLKDQFQALAQLRSHE